MKGEGHISPQRNATTHSFVPGQLPHQMSLSVTRCINILVILQRLRDETLIIQSAAVCSQPPESTHCWGGGVPNGMILGQEEKTIT